MRCLFGVKRVNVGAMFSISSCLIYQWISSGDGSVERQTFFKEVFVSDLT
jgi:hypothetical protein